MSRSGVGFAPDCVTIFEELKLKKNFKYIIYNINTAGNTIEVETTGDEEDYEAFLAKLPKDDCRYAIYDFGYELAEGGKRNKLCFYTWAPDTAPIKRKMLSASSKLALSRALNGIMIEVQGTDLGEVSHEAVLGKCEKR
ncbi:Cofilin [Arthrobotrys entomopaga]|nr:Cofilin [Arthrobotrys entomopaga]